MRRSSRPLVSIILPTYNRARFLRDAFKAIRKQSFSDWELIVVDDGSKDDTKDVFDDFKRNVSQEVKYIYQENQGPAAARNKGLNYAKGKYIAFYDSDDIWLPDHLERCIQALEKNPDVYWVFGACRLIKYPSGKVVNPNHLYDPDGTPRMVLKLKVEGREELRVIKDQKAALRCAILEGLRAGLQNSVMRSEIFKRCRFYSEHRVGEDHLLVLEALKSGFCLAYFDRVHVIYRMHEKNLSLASVSKDLEEKVHVHLEFIRALSSIKHCLTWRERTLLARRISSIYFWDMGYMFFQSKDYKKASYFFKKGLRYYPFSFKYWKIFSWCLLKKLCRLVAQLGAVFCSERFLF